MKIKTFLALGTASLLCLAKAQAAVVQNSSDSGPGSLRQAILDAAPGEIITFDSSLAGQTIGLTSGQLLINKSLAIEGLGADKLTIHGNHASRLFQIKLPAENTVHISGITITGGFADAAGGIFLEGEGTLHLTGCEIIRNSAQTYGGGVWTQGASLTVSNCTIAENVAGNGAAGLLLVRGKAKLTNTTISGNSADAVGSLSGPGGIQIYLGATVELVHCTVVANRAVAAPGGIGRNQGTIEISNSIIAQNTSDTSPFPDLDSGNSLGHNLFGTPPQYTLDATDLSGSLEAPLDPKIEPLGYNGGPTRTHALLPDSLAIDVASPSDVGVDQRGVSRPQGAASDMGAFEFEIPCGTPIVAITSPAAGAVYPVGARVEFIATFDAADGPHTAQWTIDGDVGSAGVHEPTHTVLDTVIFLEPGVYPVQLTVANACGNSSTADKIADMPASVVIYDPSAGFVTGAGWLHSPAGSYKPNPSLSGKANFAFVSKYKKGATTPIGETSFQFQAAGLAFSSQSYEWLVVSGARAQFKGVGTVNGMEGFGFILTAIDGQLSGGGGADKFRIKIWDIASSDLVYDNQMDAPDSAAPNATIGAGTIIIHK